MKFGKRELSQIFLELTQSCNLRCKHCGSDCTPAPAGTELTTAQWKAFVSYVAEHVSHSQVLFCITGGEPLLHPDFFEIVSHIQKKGFRWGLTTNATLVDDAVAKRLFDCGMVSVSVSLDGLREEHDNLRLSPGSFDATCAALRALLANRTNQAVQVTTVVHKKNLKDVPSLYFKLLDLGVCDWRIASVDPIGRADGARDLLLGAEEYHKLFRMISAFKEKNRINVQYGCAHYVNAAFGYDLRDMPYSCVAGKHVASVLANGDIVSCVDIERRKELVQGNVLKDDFFLVWETGFSIFRDEERVRRSAVCRACEFREECRAESAHTWDYEKNVPRLCLTKLLLTGDSRICEVCGKKLRDMASFCTFCGAEQKRGGEPYLFDTHHVQTLYGPPPENYRFTCLSCGARWNRAFSGENREPYCAACGSSDLKQEK